MDLRFVVAFFLSLGIVRIIVLIVEKMKDKE